MKVRRLPPLLVKSKTRGKAVLHTTFEGHRDRVPSSGDMHSYGLGDGPPRLNQQRLTWPALASLFSHTGQPAEASARLVLVMPFAESGVCSEGGANNAPTPPLSWWPSGRSIGLSWSVTLCASRRTAWQPWLWRGCKST